MPCLAHCLLLPFWDYPCPPFPVPTPVPPTYSVFCPLLPWTCYLPTVFPTCVFDFILVLVLSSPCPLPSPSSLPFCSPRTLPHPFDWFCHDPSFPGYVCVCSCYCMSPLPTLCSWEGDICLPCRSLYPLPISCRWVPLPLCACQPA